MEQQNGFKLNYDVATKFQEDALKDINPTYIALECKELTNVLIQLAKGNQKAPSTIPQKVLLPKKFSILSVRETYNHLFKIPVFQVKIEPYERNPLYNRCIVDLSA